MTGSKNGVFRHEPPHEGVEYWHWPGAAEEWIGKTGNGNGNAHEERWLHLSYTVPLIRKSFTNEKFDASFSS
jgi:hypothetical protein